MEDFLLGHMEDIEAVNDEEQIDQPGSAAEDEEEAAHDLSDEWAAKRDLITKLYWTDKRPLREVRRVLMEDHAFDKTPKQYKTRLAKWNLIKNVKGQEMEAIVRKRQDRREEDGKETEFALRGLPVDQAKIERTIKRRKINIYKGAASGAAATPPDLRLNTPPAGDTAQLADGEGTEGSDDEREAEGSAELVAHAELDGIDVLSDAKPSGSSSGALAIVVTTKHEPMWDGFADLSQPMSHLSIWRPSRTPVLSTFSERRPSSMFSWGTCYGLQMFTPSNPRSASADVGAIPSPGTGIPSGRSPRETLSHDVENHSSQGPGVFNAPRSGTWFAMLMRNKESDSGAERYVLRIVPEVHRRTMVNDFIHDTGNEVSKCREGSDIRRAFSRGDQASLLQLISETDDLEARGCGGTTFLHLAILRNIPQAVKCLLDAGANPRSCTALMVEFPLPSGYAENPVYQEVDNPSALHLAVFMSNEEVIEALLARGAGYIERSSLSPADLAAKLGCTSDVFNYLSFSTMSACPPVSNVESS